MLASSANWFKHLPFRGLHEGFGCRAWERNVACPLSLPFPGPRQRLPGLLSPALEAQGKVHPAMWQDPRSSAYLCARPEPPLPPLVGAWPADHQVSSARGSAHVLLPGPIESPTGP